MTKKYIDVRHSYMRWYPENWLLRIPESQLSSDSKIVWILLKRLQLWHMGCHTDARTWEVISGMPVAKILECFNELQKFGLIEQYLSKKSRQSMYFRRHLSCFLLHHPLMGDMYPIVDKPHDDDSFENPQDFNNQAGGYKICKVIDAFRDELKQREEV